MTFEEFIKKAIDGGWKPFGSILHKNLVEQKWGVPEVLANFYHQPTFLLDPKFWEAVGKVEEWNFNNQYTIIRNGSEIAKSIHSQKMHQMIDHLIEGGTIKSYLETL